MKLVKFSALALAILTTTFTLCNAIFAQSQSVPEILSATPQSIQVLNSLRNAHLAIDKSITFDQAVQRTFPNGAWKAFIAGSKGLIIVEFDATWTYSKFVKIIGLAGCQANSRCTSTLLKIGIYCDKHPSKSCTQTEVDKNANTSVPVMIMFAFDPNTGKAVETKNNLGITDEQLLDLIYKVEDHDAATTTHRNTAHDPIVNVVRSSYLEYNKTISIGQALDHKFQNGTWKSFTSDKGATIVEFDGTIPFKKISGMTLDLNATDNFPPVCGSTPTCVAFAEQITKSCQIADNKTPINSTTNTQTALPDQINALQQKKSSLTDALSSAKLDQTLKPNILKGHQEKIQYDKQLLAQHLALNDPSSQSAIASLREDIKEEEKGLVDTKQAIASMTPPDQIQTQIDQIDAQIAQLQQQQTDDKTQFQLAKQKNSECTTSAYNQHADDPVAISIQFSINQVGDTPFQISGNNMGLNTLALLNTIYE